MKRNGVKGLEVDCERCGDACDDTCSITAGDTGSVVGVIKMYVWCVLDLSCNHVHSLLLERAAIRCHQIYGITNSFGRETDTTQ